MSILQTISINFYSNPNHVISNIHYGPPLENDNSYKIISLENRSVKNLLSFYILRDFKDVIKKEGKVYIENTYPYSKVIIGCLVKTIKKINSIDFIASYLETRISGFILDEECKACIKKFKRPITAWFCGDSTNGESFRDTIESVIKSLPKYSVIALGSKEGVDKVAKEEIVKINNFYNYITISERIMYHIIDESILTILNSVKPEKLFIFHQNFEKSNSTKKIADSCVSCYIPVYIYDDQDLHIYKGVSQ